MIARFSMIAATGLALATFIAAQVVPDQVGSMTLSGDLVAVSLFFALVSAVLGLARISRDGSIAKAAAIVGSSMVVLVPLAIFIKKFQEFS